MTGGRFPVWVLGYPDEWSVGPAASSIAWSGALSFAAYENNVSRITANVLDRFIGGRA